MVCCGVLWLVCGGWSSHDMTIVCVEMDVCVSCHGLGAVGELTD